MMKTYSPKQGDLTHGWHLIDADGLVLGRLASEAATILMGKHKPGFAPHVDGGDNVVIINAARITVTGNKLRDKKYYRHSGYPGGIKEIGLADLLQKDPQAVIVTAVRGMLPKNRLQDDRLKRLKVYAGSEHPHQGQEPKALSVNAKRGE